MEQLKGSNVEEFVRNIEEFDPEVILEDHISKLPEQEIVHIKKELHIKACLLPENEFRIIRAKLTDTLRQIMEKIAAKFDVVLLPPSPQDPYDQLFCYDRHDNLVGPLTELSLPLWRLLIQYHCKLKLGLKLLLSFKVNTTWIIAPKSQMTPREILGLCGMDYTQYTLYLPDSADPLPLDEVMTITRGDYFEALKDGKYGNK
jgi:hypothetical protein